MVFENKRIEIVKRAYCIASLFLMAWAVIYLISSNSWESPWSVFFVSDLREKDWSRISVFATVLLTGGFILPVFVDDQLKVTFLVKSALGYALSTYICAVSFLYSQSLYRIIINNYDEKYGTTFIGDLSIVAFGFAPFGLVITLPIWLVGGWVSQAFWPHIRSRFNGRKT